MRLLAKSNALAHPPIKEKGMTEEEAKLKWCPHVNVAGTFNVDGEEIGFSGSNRFGSPFYNAPIELQGATRCIASDCMMWKKKFKLLEYFGLLSNEGHCGLTN